MKRLGFMIAAVALSIGPVKGADMSVVKAAPYAVAGATYNWTGFYLGVQAGGQWSAFPLSGSTSGAVTTIPGFGDPGVIGANAVGFNAGLHAGFNYKFAPSLVAGIEGDVSISSINSNGAGVSSLGGVNLLSVQSAASIPWKGEILGKLGVLIMPDVLLYGTGGVTFAEIKENASLQSVFLPGGINGAFDDVHVGWAAGAGVDWSVGNFIVGFRYLYEQWGTRGVTLMDPNLTSSYNAAVKAATNEATARVSLRF